MVSGVGPEVKALPPMVKFYLYHLQIYSPASMFNLGGKDVCSSLSQYVI